VELCARITEADAHRLEQRGLRLSSAGTLGEVFEEPPTRRRSSRVLQAIATIGAPLRWRGSPARAHAGLRPRGPARCRELPEINHLGGEDPALLISAPLRW
jgi:hypothetical protein